MNEDRKILIRNNVVAVVGLFLVTLLVWGFGELRILIVGEPTHSWGSSLTSLYTPAIWFLLFGLIFLRHKSTFNSLSVLAVPVAAILFFWPAGIYALTIGMSEVTAHWGFHARALITMLGEISDAFMIFIPDTPGDPMSGGSSGGYNFFSGGIAAGIYAAIYMYFGVGIKGFALRLFASRRKDSQADYSEIKDSADEASGLEVTPHLHTEYNGDSADDAEEMDTASPLQAQDSQELSLETRESLRKPLLINNVIALIGHFAILGIAALIMYVVNNDFLYDYLGYFEWIHVLFMTFFIAWSNPLLTFALHFIAGGLLLKALPRLNFLSVISIVIFSAAFIAILPLLIGMFTFDDFQFTDIFWSIFYVIPSIVLAFTMYLGVFVKAFISGNLRKREEDNQLNEQAID